MSGRGTEKRLLRAFEGPSADRVPFWFMRQAGRYLPEYRSLRQRTTGFLDFCFTPEIAIEATLQPLRRYGMDAAILFSDILVVPHALGQPVAFREGEGPVLEPVRSVSQVACLHGDGALERLAPVFAALRGIAAAIAPETALIGFAGAPWTVATYMVEGRGGTDFVTVRGWAEKDPNGFSVLIDLLSTVTADYLIEQVRNGAEVLQLFDTWAGVLDEAAFRRWVVAPTRRIVEAVKVVHPGIRIIGFPRGCGKGYGEFLARTGIDGVSLDSTIGLETAVGIQAGGLVQGNLDPRVLVEGGAALETATRAILGALSGGRFIFNLGHGIVPETPPEHVAAVSQIVRDWNPVATSGRRP